MAGVEPVVGTLLSAPPTLRPPVLWLHLGIGVSAGLAIGAGLLAASTPVYASSASVLVGSMGTDVNMRTEAELVGATKTAADAFARLASSVGAEGDLGPPVVGELARVEPLPGTSVLVITFEAGSAARAQAGATAFAEAYLAARAEAARAAVDAQIAATQQRLDEVRVELGGVTMLIDMLPSDSAELGSLRAAQETLTTEAGSLTTRLHELRTTSIEPGRIVAAAAVPTAPVRPGRRLVLGLATAGGVLAGLLLHLLRTRWSQRVRRVADLRRHRVPVLADRVPAAVSALPYDRLRNEIVAALTPSDRIILVTGAAPGPASMLVAANLAAAFARADSDVVLVGASVPRHQESLATLFDLADIPGLTDVLAGRTTMARAVQQAGRHPRLRVVTPGGTGTAGGLLQSEGARSVLRQLATRTRYVIVDAPSTASGADAQSLAGAADVALLVVELNQTRHAQIADAVIQLARVGTTLLGAVLVARSAATDEPETWSRSPAPPPAYQTEAWIGGRPASRPERSGPASRPERSGPASWPERSGQAALDGPTRTIERLNRGRIAGGRVASTAVDATPRAAHPTVMDPTVTDPTVTDPTVTDSMATDPTATDRTGSPPKASNAP